MEKWDILDSQGKPTGRVALRGETILSSEEYHLVVHIWIVSSDGKFLIQKRSPLKRLMPGEWAATGGAALSGESSFAAATRELKEELGIDSDKNSLKFIKRIKRRNSFVDVWYINCDTPVEDLTLQESEVERARWVNKETLQQMIKNGSFHNYGNYYWSVVFDNIKRTTVGV
ncbi:MAG: NUDIX domain-containing protein [Clostridia bacterium]|nr:NUDIX domain-containing protein [Clostridia bacterium]